MIESFLILLTAHLLADFPLQPDGLVEWKKTRWGLAAHIGVVGILAAVLLLPTQLSALAPLAWIIATHCLMDWLKTRWLGDGLWAFALDQAVHLSVIAVLAVLWPEMAHQSLWARLPGDVQAHVYAAMSLISGLATGVFAGGVLIRKLVSPLSPTEHGATNAGEEPENPAASPPTWPQRLSLSLFILLNPNLAGTVARPPARLGPIAGMENAGRYIGWLERALTIMFILIKQPEGVALLLAAKSVLRFRDVQDQNDRHQAEYIIIGTFLSFGWALLVAVATRSAMLRWVAG